MCLVLAESGRDEGLWYLPRQSLPVSPIAIMEQPSVSLAPKRPRRSDYEEMRDLTEAYLRKVKHSLEAEHCNHAGALQSSLQRYFASDQFTRDYSDAIPRTSVLAFIMHAAEVAVSQKLEDKEEPKKAEMACQTTPSPEPQQLSTTDSITECPKEQVEMQAPASVFQAQPVPPVPALTQEVETNPKPKTIFKTEPGRKGSEGGRKKPPRKQNVAISPGLGKAVAPIVSKPPQRPTVPAPVQVPAQPYYPPTPEFTCELCGEKFWVLDQLTDHKYESHPPNEQQNYDPANAISCPIFGCDEHFEDNSDLLLHMRTVHST